MYEMHIIPPAERARTFMLALFHERSHDGRPCPPSSRPLCRSASRPLPRPRADRTARRTELASAAARVFAARGVANTAVSDIVKAAGVAQGTFYLCFGSKDDVVLAVVEQMVDGVGAAIETAVAETGHTAFENITRRQ